jgi:hypothetical protein
MVDYCEEEFMCRRVMALEYFDEKFDSKDCNSMCDNCNKNLSCIEKDFTKESLIILNFVKNCSDKLLKITISQSVDYLIGKNGRQHMSWPMNDRNKGALININANIIKKIIRKLILLGYLDEFLVLNGNNVYSRIEISQKGINYLYNKNNNMQNNLDNIYISLKGEPKKLEEESDEEDIIDSSSIIEQSENKKEISEKKKENKNKNKSETRKKRKKAKNEINNEEEDFGLCQNKELFDKLFNKLKKRRDEILQKVNGNNDNDEDDDDYHLNEFKEEKKEKYLSLDDIFTNNGLKDLCRKLPNEEKELNDKNIYGVNKKSLETYGKEFLPIIKDFIKDNTIKKEEIKKELDKEDKKKEKKNKGKNKNKKKKNDKNKDKDKEESKENKDNDIFIPDNGVYNQENEEDYNNLFLFESINEEPNESKKDENENKDKNEEKQKEEENIFEDKENDSNDYKNDIDENIVNQARELAKIDKKKGKKSKKNSENSESDDEDNSKNKKKKNNFSQYNYFQRKAIWNKINKGRYKKK